MHGAGRTHRQRRLLTLVQPQLLAAGKVERGHVAVTGADHDRLAVGLRRFQRLAGQRRLPARFTLGGKGQQLTPLADGEHPPVTHADTGRQPGPGIEAADFAAGSRVDDLHAAVIACGVHALTVESRFEHVAAGIADAVFPADLQVDQWLQRLQRRRLGGIVAAGKQRAAGQGQRSKQRNGGQLHREGFIHVISHPVNRF